MEEKLFNKGQSLFEVVVALTISALIIVAIVSLAANSIRNAAFSRNKTLAARYAEEATEWLRGERDSNTLVFFTKAQAASSVWCLNSLSGWPAAAVARVEDCTDPIVDTNFLRAVELIHEDVGANFDKKLITANVVVFWQDAQGIHEVRSSTNFVDWRER